MLNNQIIEDISILIVEDENELLEYLQEYLQIFFKNVFIARCGNEGYDVYLQKRPDIILSDINMPNLDGLMMAKKIKEIDKEQIILIMSAFDDKENLFSSIDIGIEKFITKPIDIEQLESALQKASQELEQRANQKKILDVKVCQDNNKALMSNPNRDLGQWILRDVLGLKEGELLTYEKLQLIGIDSIRLDKVDKMNFKINFVTSGSFEEYLDVYEE